MKKIIYSILLIAIVISGCVRSKNPTKTEEPKKELYYECFLEEREPIFSTPGGDTQVGLSSSGYNMRSEIVSVGTPPENWYKIAKGWVRHCKDFK